MITDRRKLDLTFSGLKTIFQNALKRQGRFNVSDIATTINSSVLIEVYEWLSNLPQMREWRGSKHIEAVRGNNYKVENTPWEGTIEIPQRNLQHNNLGAYRALMEGLSNIARALPERLVLEALTAGFAEKCYDGKAFYATDHPLREDDTFSNKGTAAFAIDTQDNIIASLGAGFTALASMLDFSGEPLDYTPDVLVVPPALEAKARVAEMSERLEDGKVNPYRGRFKCVVSNRLKTATEWHLLVTMGGIKPFLLQTLEEPMVTMLGMDSDHYFDTKRVRISAEADMAAGYTLPQLAYASTGAA